MFTIEEYEDYKKSSSSLNKRMMNLVSKRLSDNLQLLERSSENLTDFQE